MAKNKKSFITYTDWRDTFNALPDGKAGQLIKHIFAYVNDENPKTEDVLINAVFANIKQQLKRDLKKWEKTSTKRIDIGRLGGIKSGEARRSKPKQNEAIASSLKQNEHDICNMLDDNDNVTVKEKKKKEFTPPSLEQVEEYFGENGYKQDSAIKAFNYYSVANWKDSKGNQVKNWKQKMQGVWFKDENKINGNKPKFVF
jgi:hypothetical protein